MSLRLIANWKLNGSKEFNDQWAQEFFKNFSSSNFKSIGIAPACIYIDHFRKVIGIAMIKKPFWEVSQTVKIEINKETFDGKVCDLPFI